MGKEKKIRVRFAPSPTGPLHIGGLRTALYNYLFAKKNKGEFILRIEDTDQSRFVRGAEEHIKKSLSWCGIEPDESPEKGGLFSPYRQSDRVKRYKRNIKELVDRGYAYIAFDSEKELEEARKKQKEISKTPFQYDSQSRLKMKNSLTLKKEETKRLLEKKTPHVVRIKITPNKKIFFRDKIRGKIEINTTLLDDKVLLKTDGMPTYHFANVVDDYEMKITHVIRGEEWLPSTPLHVFLYKAFGWEKKTPQFVHLPLILKPSGEGKMSKRDGLKMGYPVFPLSWETEGKHIEGFKEKGFLPEALINILALLGWNPGTQQEIFTLKKLIKEFSLIKISKGGSRFDIKKAKWINQQFLQKTETQTLEKHLKEELKKRGIEKQKKEKKIIKLVHKRLELLKDIWVNVWFFYERPKTDKIKGIKKKWKKNTKTCLEKLAELFKNQKTFNATENKRTIERLVFKGEYSFSDVMIPLRNILTGTSSGPDLFIIMEILGKKEVLQRLKKF